LANEIYKNTKENLGIQDMIIPFQLSIDETYIKEFIDYNMKDGLFYGTCGRETQYHVCQFNFSLESKDYKQIIEFGNVYRKTPQMCLIVINPLDSRFARVPILAIPICGKFNAKICFELMELVEKMCFNFIDFGFSLGGASDGCPSRRKIFKEILKNSKENTNLNTVFGFTILKDHIVPGKSKKYGPFNMVQNLNSLTICI
jgi:hypothetical protein